MTFWEWTAWALLLCGQNAAFTWVSRARNSGSWKYSWVAGLFSNGLWWIGQFFVVGAMVEVKRTGSVTLFAVAGVFYALMCTTSGSMAQLYLMKNVETGKRKVGAT